VLFDPATIERPLRGTEIASAQEGWSWQELDSIDSSVGGAPRSHVDAFKLLAAFVQHTDTKPDNQTLVCLDEPVRAGRCAHPFLFVGDLGLTFGRANAFNNNVRAAMNLDEWSSVPVWNEPTQCVANLARSITGTLENPVISEQGRRFLASLLSQLTDAQIRDLFVAARVQLRPRIPYRGRSGFPAVEEWVKAFKVKRDQIVEHRCPMSPLPS